MDSLTTLRKQLDEIDQNIVKMLDQRMELAHQIATCKDALGSPMVDLEREKEVLGHALQAAKDPILHDHIPQFFQLLMDCAKKGRAFKKHTEFPFRSVGIVGVGLIGGSIAKAIKAKSNAIAVYGLKDPSGSKLTILDGEFSDLETLARAVEVIFLTVPLDNIIPLAHIIPQTGHSLCVIDVGSVKHPICEEFEELTKGNNEFIATHPMAGSEKQGVSHSYATLFIHAPWVVTPHKKNSQNALKKVEEVIRFLGANPLMLDSITHDKRAALISQIPWMLSKRYFDYVLLKDKDSLNMASTGFHSFTRLAGSNAQLRSQINQMNHYQISGLWSQLLEDLKYDTLPSK